MKAKMILFMLAGITLLFPACISPEVETCHSGSVSYTIGFANYISNILCEPNGLCGKEKNIHWNREGQSLTTNGDWVFFRVNEQDTLLLGTEYNRFYLYEGWPKGKEYLYPIFSYDDVSYFDSNVLRIALKDDMEQEEKAHIYRVLSEVKYLGVIIVQGEIRFYKSKDDPYFDSKHDYLPELVVSSVKNIAIEKYY